MVGGVAAGLSAHLGVSVLWVRVVFVILGLLAGSGVLAYGLMWVMTPAVETAPTVTKVRAVTTGRENRMAVGLGALGLALCAALLLGGFGTSTSWMVGPVAIVAVGAAFIWREADEAQRARWRGAPGAGRVRRIALLRIAGGALLVIAGLVTVILGNLTSDAIAPVLLAAMLTLVGVVVITVPWWMRLVRDLGAERAARQRQAERAEIAAHLHDSVLQTLALIQRRPDEAAEVHRLARRQERELRSWLYGPGGIAGRAAANGASLSKLLSEAAAEVEDTFGVTITPVLVGDTPMTDDLNALVGAAREAMVNAAKHSGETSISLYAEVENGIASVFVRDRGVGFDHAAIGADRRGLSESVRGRMQRHGGVVRVRTAPGSGTEVELVMPLAAGGKGEKV